MTKIIIFKQSGESYRVIDNPESWVTEGSLLRVTFKDGQGESISIRTTLPYFFEESGKEAAGAAFKAHVW